MGVFFLVRVPLWGGLWGVFLRLEGGGQFWFAPACSWRGGEGGKRGDGAPTRGKQGENRPGPKSGRRRRGGPACATGPGGRAGGPRRAGSPRVRRGRKSKPFARAHRRVHWRRSPTARNR